MQFIKNTGVAKSKRKQWHHIFDDEKSVYGLSGGGAHL